jgi:hypothetical protein
MLARSQLLPITEQQLRSDDSAWIFRRLGSSKHGRRKIRASVHNKGESVHSD